MGLFKRAHVRGINHGLMRMGLIAYPNEKIAEEAADAVADEMPEEAVPEVTDESGLTHEELQMIMQRLNEIAEALAVKTGGARDLELNKLAASFDIGSAAAAHAGALMEKAALEAGTNNPGQGSPSMETGTVEAKIDAANTPSAALVVPKGDTSLDTSPGEVGAQSIHMNQPGTQEGGGNDVLKTGGVNALLAKLSADGVLPAGAPRKDLDTNADMGKNMIVSQGTTKSSTPAEPVPLKPNPAAKGVKEDSKPGTDMQDDVKKAAEVLMATDQGRQIIAKLAQDQAQKRAELGLAEQTLLTALQQTRGR